MNSRMHVWMCALMLAGCKASPQAPAPLPRGEAPAAHRPDPARAKPVTTETARSAAMILASRPIVNDPRTRQEIALHSALYRAAHQSNVGGFNHFLLEPLPDALKGEPGTVMPALAIDEREFALRVLADLADLGVPIAWAAPGRFDGAQEWFPQTRERATRLRIRINRRIEDQATVHADVGDWTADIGSSRQAVIATWDGQQWSIQRDRVRLVW